jgi:uncharacterized RmlC-like cupin family protein
MTLPTCKVIRLPTGSTALCMTMLTPSDGARAKTHLHQGIETAVYVIEGETETA